jgi:hypothetical protein
MIEVADRNPGVPGSRRILTVTASQRLIGSHLAGGRELDCGGHVYVHFPEYRAISLKDGRQTDFRVPVPSRDGWLGSLWSGEKRRVNLFRENPDVLIITGRKRDEIHEDFSPASSDPGRLNWVGK